MTDRKVVVGFEARVNSYLAGVAKARSETRAFSAAVAKASDEDLKRLGFSAGIAATALIAGAVKAEQVWARFGKAMSGVAAVSNASAREMQALGDAALKAGASTKLAGVTASDAARSEAELVRAGVSVSDVLGGALVGSLSLASAGQLDFGQAAEIAAQSMNIFKLSGRDVGHVADVLAAGANKSAADVGQLGEALRQGGLVASQLGFGIEDTVGALSLFADHALIGSDAGTSLKTMLQRLAPTSKEAKDEMESLGFSAFDAQGKFVGLEQLTANLQQSFAGLSDEQRSTALTTIFGTDAVRAAMVLIDAGAVGVRDYTTAVNDQGAAARMAATQVDNLSGDIEALGGAFEVALIKSGEQTDGVARATVQNLADMVSGYAALPPAAQQAGVAIGVTAAGTLGLVAVVGTLLPRVREVTTSLGNMGKTGQFVGRNLGGIAKGAGGAAVAVALLARSMGNAQKNADDLVQSLTGSIDATNLGSVTQGLDGVQSKLRELDDEWGDGGFFDTVSNVIAGTVETLTPLEDSIANNVAATNELLSAQEQLVALQFHLAENFSMLAASTGLSSEQIVDLAKSVGVDLTQSYDKVVPPLEAAYDKIRTGAPLTDQLAAATSVLTSDVKDATAKLDAYGSALDAIYDIAYDVSEGTDKLTSSIGDLYSGISDGEAAGDKFAASLDSVSRSGLANRDALRGIVRDALDVAKAMVAQGDSQTVVALRMQGFHDALVDGAVGAGLARDQVEFLTAALLQLPTDTGFSITADVDQAIRALDVFIDRVSKIPSFIQSHVSAAEEHDAVRFRNLLTIGMPSIRSSLTDSVRNAPSVARSSPAGGGGGGGGRDAAADAADQAEQDRKAWIAAEDEFERNLHDHQMKSTADYVAYLDGRLGQETEFSAAYFTILNERQRVLDQQAADVVAWNDALARNQADALKLWNDTIDRQHETGDRSTEQYLADLRARLAGLQKYSDEWMQVWRQINQIEQDAADETRRIADDRAAALKDAYDAALKTQADAFSRLNSLLDDEQRLRKQQEDLAAEHTQRLADIAAKYVDDQASMLVDRRQQLLGWVGIEERATFKVASSVKALAKNAQSQLTAFSQWTEALAAARGRGVSEAVIGMLGLDEGPQSLVQLRMFSSATQTEIDDLNRAVEARQQQAGDRVSAEAGQSYSKVAGMLRDLAEKHAAEVEKLTEDFLATERDLSVQLALLGLDAGRSYGEAVAAGLASSIPAIVAAAQAARDAVLAASGAHIAEASAGVTPAQQAQKAEAMRQRFPNPLLKSITAPKDIPGHAAGIAYVPSTGLANIHQGERILSVPDNRALIAAVGASGAGRDLDYNRLGAAVASAVSRQRPVQFGDVIMRDGVDIDLLGRRLAFALTPGGF